MSADNINVKNISIALRRVISFHACHRRVLLLVFIRNVIAESANFHPHQHVDGQLVTILFFAVTNWLDILMHIECDAGKKFDV